MTATVGVTFGAGSAAKRILLFAINVTILLLGVTCSVLSLYQVKLMPETYDVIVADMKESNLTISAIPVLPPATASSRNSSINGQSTIQPGSKKGNPRVSRYARTRNNNSYNQPTLIYPILPTAFLKDINSSTKTGTSSVSSSLGVQMSITNSASLSQTTVSTVTKASIAGNSFSTQGVTLAQLKNSTSQGNELASRSLKDTINFEEGIGPKILGQESYKSTDKTIEATATSSLVIQLPFGKFDASELASETITSAPPRTLLSTVPSFPTTKILPSTTAKAASSTPPSTTSLASMQPLIFNSSAFLSSLLASSTPTTIVTRIPVATVTTPATSSTTTSTTSSSAVANLITTSTELIDASTSLVGSTFETASTPEATTSMSTTPTTRSIPIETTPEETIRFAASATTTEFVVASTSPVGSAFSVTTTIIPNVSTTLIEASFQTVSNETTATAINSPATTIPTGIPPTVPTLFATSQAITNPKATSMTPFQEITTEIATIASADTISDATKKSIVTSVSASTTESSELTGELVSAGPITIHSASGVTALLEIPTTSTRSISTTSLPSLTSSTPRSPETTGTPIISTTPVPPSSTYPASISSTTILSKQQSPLASVQATTTSAPTLSPSQNSSSPVTTLASTTTSGPISTILFSTSSAATTKLPTTSAPGFLDLSSVLKNLGRRDLFRHRLQKRAAATMAPEMPTDVLTPDHIPGYFEQLFFLVQTSLYVGTAAGLLIFFSSLAGICGGLFRIDGCLKFSVAALVLVIMSEMATIAFIFFAHDKASNRNKNKNFDRDLKLLCDLANFCVQPMLLVIVGSFMCVSVVLQIGSITLACNLMERRTESDPEKKFRKMMRSNRADFQFGAGSMYPYSNPMPMPMPMHCCGGAGAGAGYGGNNFPYPSPVMMPMQNMGYYPPVFGGPGQRPIVNIIS